MIIYSVWRPPRDQLARLLLTLLGLTPPTKCWLVLIMDNGSFNGWDITCMLDGHIETWKLWNYLYDHCAYSFSCSCCHHKLITLFHFSCLKVWNELDHVLSFFLSNCLTGKGWVTPLRALLSAIFYGVWGLRFHASLGKLCLKSLYFMWNTTGVPHCGSSSLFLCKMIRLVTNLLFCFLVSLFKPDKRQRWVMFRCGVGKLHPPELLTWWELLRKTVMIKTTKVAPPSFPSIRPGV